VNLRELLTSTRSYRRFLQQPLDRGTLVELVELTRLCPSAANRQPLRYLVACTAEENARIFPHLRWAAALTDWPGPGEGQRPTGYIIILGDTRVWRRWDWDCGIAAHAVLLGAAERGLGGCMIGSLDQPGLRAVLNLPAHLEVLLVVALGKPDETVVLEDGRPEPTPYWRDAQGVHHVPKRPMSELLVSLCMAIVLLLLPAAAVLAQKPLKTPLAPETLRLLANELSGQMIYNNLVKLAGAPWIRRAQEFSGTFYEPQAIYDLVREYGIESTRLERYAGKGTYDYPMEGELWLLEPEKRLVARLEADPALVARGSRTADVTGELVYVAPVDRERIKKLSESGQPPEFRGKVALMWSHPSGDDAKMLAAAGVQAVISFSSRERYFDPGQVVYASGAYDKYDPLVLGLTVSWRQWSELLEDLSLGKKIVVRARARVEKQPEKQEIVYSWIPGTEPEAKGVVFTAHLFDGFVKRGTNDNMNGCAIQLEMLRALLRMIAPGAVRQTRRTIHFVWAAEFSGTYAFLKHHPDFRDRLSININMDMVGEGLRQNNAALRMSQCPGHLPSYLDGLARSVLNYVWRTNDIVFQSGVPAGRPGGQYFAIPMWEKNGSLDAFRFSIHPTMGGSDHACFHNPAVAVPGIMLLIWPDQWYHADTDTPDKSDPTQLKRSAFIGAAIAWAAAQCTDDVAAGLAEAASEYGYLRVAEREIPRAMARLDAADARQLAAETAQALRLVAFGAGRELAAVRSIEDVFSGSPAAKAAVQGKSRQWELYGQALRTQVMEYAKSRAVQLNSQAPAEPQPDELQRKCQAVTPRIADWVKGREFDLWGHEKYKEYLKDRPDPMKALKIARPQATAILNFVNGRRSIAEIGDCVAAELDEEVPLKAVVGWLEVLKAVGWVIF